ncbi:MAG: sodium:solute symporter family protein [Eubacterium sp.]|jgi:sodium/pantothenate symporter
MSVYLVVFIVYFAIIIISSIIGSKKVETMGDFTTGGNKMGLVLGVGTSMATWLSVASVMGVPGNIYSRGVCAITGWIGGWFLATSMMPIVAYKIRRPEVPCRTFPEFIHLRYDPYSSKSVIRIVVACIELVGYFIFSYIQIQGFGIVLSSITGMSYYVCCLFFMVLLIFTCMGGFQSVARTDTVNALLILIGVIAGAITVMNITGGWEAMKENFITTTAPAIEGQPDLEPGVLGSAWGVYGASAIISIFLANAFGSVVAPHWVSRFMAPRNAKTAALQMFIVVLLLVPVFIALVLIGIGGKMIIPSLPEGMTSDYMFPQLIINYLNPVLGSLALTAICAAAVSTANSMLLHCSTSLVYDIKRVIQNKEASEEHDNKTTKELRTWILLLGLIAVICAMGRFSFLADGFTYVYGAFGSTFFAPIMMGVLMKRMNQPAAWVSMGVGMSMYLYCTICGAPFGLPTFIVSAGLSIISALITMAFTKKPPVVSYEAFFNDYPSQETIDTIHRIRKDAIA